MSDEHNAPVSERRRAMCIDLDGTLLKTDLLLEAMLALLSRNLLYLFALPLWLLKGKAGFKREVALRVSIDPRYLPYDERVVELLKSNPDRVRVLCTASDELLIDPIAKHFGLFDKVIASNGVINLAGSVKARSLIGMFGERGYDYAGNAPVDKAVWATAHGAWVVNARHAVMGIARSCCEVLAYMPPQGNRLRAWLKALRLHQWLKNLLVFVPVLAAHRFLEAESVSKAVLAFFAFGISASSVYIINDLLDMQVDRLHPRKRNRPFASGALSALSGVVGGLLLAASGFGLSLLVSPAFTFVLCVYYVLTLAYSFKLKRVVVIDVVLLAGLYTVRIIAGAAAIGSILSFWLLAFSVFIFLSLALVKRFAEVHALMRKGGEKAAGRDYHVEDLPIIASLGSSAGYLAVLVLAMYINSPESLALYASPKVLWALCPIFLYWTSRIWFITARGEMHDDPVVFAVRDGVSQLVGISTLVVVALATLSW